MAPQAENLSIITKYSGPVINLSFSSNALFIGPIIQSIHQLDFDALHNQSINQSIMQFIKPRFHQSIMHPKNECLCVTQIKVETIERPMIYQGRHSFICSQVCSYNSHRLRYNRWLLLTPACRLGGKIGCMCIGQQNLVSRGLCVHTWMIKDDLAESSALSFLYCVQVLEEIKEAGGKGMVAACGVHDRYVELQGSILTLTHMLFCPQGQR